MSAILPVAGGALLAMALATCVAPPPSKAPVLATSAPPAQAQPRTGFRIEGEPRQGSLLRGLAPEGTAALTLGGEAVPLDTDGLFMIGIDRDQQGELNLAARLKDGREIRHTLPIQPGAWRIEHVDAPLRPSGSSEAARRARAAELARIAAARRVNAVSNGWRQSFIWPARGRISGVFGSQRVYRGEPGSFHTGVDVAPGVGAAVVAPADGVVVLAGPPAFSLEGNLVIVDHGRGLNSAFLHLATVSVSEGQAVRQGQSIGTIGATGRATGPHLHWSMKWRNARIDPQRVAGPMPAR